MKILIDINVSNSVYERIKSLGFDVVRVVDIFPKGADDEDILRWMRDNDALIITYDKRFPGANHRKVILACASKDEASSEAITKLITLRVFPKGLESSAELYVFSSFMREIDSFFKGTNLKAAKRI